MVYERGWGRTMAQGALLALHQGSVVGEEEEMYHRATKMGPTQRCKS